MVFRVIDGFLPKLTGKNLKSTPPQVIIDQMMEPRRLPLGRQEFEEWSDRIIAGAMIPFGGDDHQAFIDSKKCTLAAMIMHLGPTESHKPDAFFIHSLLKGAQNQVAYDIGTELREKAKKRLSKKEQEAKEVQEKEHAEEALKAL